MIEPREHDICHVFIRKTIRELLLDHQYSLVNVANTGQIMAYIPQLPCEFSICLSPRMSLPLSLDGVHAVNTHHHSPALQEDGWVCRGQTVPTSASGKNQQGNELRGQALIPLSC